MANTNKTIDYITKEVLRIAHEKATFLSTIDRQYDEEFGKKGMKVGDTIRIRTPEKGTIRTGRVAQVQDSVETNTTLTVSTQKGFDLAFNGSEATLDLDDYVERKIKPRLALLISTIESEVLQGATKLVPQVAGTAGTPPADLLAFGAARAKLNQQAVPKDSQRCIQLDSVTMSGLVNAFRSQQNPVKDLDQAFREGFIERTSMADWYENERVWTMTNGADVTSVTLDTYTVVQGDADLTVTGFATPTAGMVFTIAGVFDVHPETKAAYTHLKQFVILEGSTATNLLISPAIYSTGKDQNVSALPTTTAALVFVGAASTSYTQNLMYHKEFCTFATADLPLHASAEKCVRQNHEGLSFRVWQAPDIVNDQDILRVDILYGWKVLRPDWACRITS